MKILLDCDPGHDDAIAITLALTSPEVELVGVTTVHGNQTLDKTTRQRAEGARVHRPHRRPGRRRRCAGRSCAPFVAEYVHGESGLGRADLAGRDHRARPGARGRIHRRRRSAPGRADHARPDRAADQHRALPRAHPDVARADRPHLADGRRHRRGQLTPAAEFNIWVDPEAARIVFQSGRRSP